MVVCRGSRLLAGVFLALCTLYSLSAEIRTEISSAAWFGYSESADSPWSVGVGGGGLMSFLSPSNASVKARFDLDLDITGSFSDATSFSGMSLSVPRAYVIARLRAGEDYSFRFTLGKNRISWGEGIAYNAGDLFNGARSILDLSSAVLRDESLWFAAFFFPLDTFAFLEPVVLFPQFEQGLAVHFESASLRAAPYETPSLDDMAGGLRVQSKNFGIKWELGYLYRPSSPSGYEQTGPHLSYLSLQGHLGVDWYASLAFHVPNDPAGDFDSVDLSVGLFHSEEVASAVDLSFRLETLIRVHEAELYILPEVLAAFGQSWSAFLRVEWQPLGGDWNVFHEAANISTGFQFSHFQGFSLDCAVSMAFADGSFSTAVVSLAMSYVF